MRDVAAGIAAGLVLAAAVLALAPAEPSTVRTVRMTADVAPQGDNLSIGVSVDRDRIDFGTVPSRNLTVEKRVEVANGGSAPVTLTAAVTGNISAHVTAAPARAELRPGTARNITVTFHSSADLTPGDHLAGELRVRRR